LTNVTIPNSVTSIGVDPFGHGYSLTAITVGTRNSVYSDLDGVLFNRSLTTLVQYPGAIAGSYAIPNSVTSIGDGAFNGCGNLTNVTIPNSVTTIWDHAFDLCESLTNVTIPNSVTNIGDYAFDLCESLTNITIPNSVTSIGSGAFSSCSSLTSVTIGSKVTSIGDYAFYGCWSLTSVTIPNSVNSIGTNAFSYCTSLTSVYFQGNAPSLGSFVFGFSGGSGTPWDPATIYYLPGTTGWSDFSTNTGLPTALWTPQVLTTASSFGVRTNQFGFNINWASGMTVVVEACTNLANPTWYPLATNTLSGGSAYFSDPQWTNHTRRFYRLRSQ
jgi:hypothetical protein